MDAVRTKHFSSALHHLYINPLEKCNLRCKICYTRKTAPILTEQEIIDFITRYSRVTEVKVITFCGGEVCGLSYFPSLVNRLTEKGIFVQIITNGTIDRLGEFKTSNSINFIVSVDGPQVHHDANRGEGRFQQSMAYLVRAKSMGFHTEVFTIVTKQNINRLDEFETYLQKKLGEVAVTYHPRKPLAYLNIHPVSNTVGDTQGFDFLSNDELRAIMKRRNVFPPRELGCYQIALTSDGMVYGCCEGFDPLGKMNDNMEDLIGKLKSKIGGACLGCSQPSFMCGIKNLLETKGSHVQS